MKQIYTTIVVATFWSVLGISQAWANDIPRSDKDIEPLGVGDALPDITLTDVNGTDQELRSLAREQPLLLIYYRGGW